MRIEHVAVLLSHRGKRIGSRLMLLMIDVARSQGVERIQLSARTDAQVFYEELGFKMIGEEFEDFGSPHIIMERELAEP